MMEGMRAVISTRERFLPVKNYRNGGAEKFDHLNDYGFVVNELQQLELLIELEDMENDRAGDSVFAYGFEI